MKKTILAYQPYIEMVSHNPHILIIANELLIRKNKVLVAGIYKPPRDIQTTRDIQTDFITSLETIVSKLSNSYDSCGRF